MSSSEKPRERLVAYFEERHGFAGARRALGGLGAISGPPSNEEAGVSLGFEQIVESDRSLLRVETAGAGPQGRLPLTAEMLLERPSGDIFGLTQNAGMGWDPRELGRPQYLILGTQGGVRAPDGTPIALGYHTGHWEIGLLIEAAARELAALECLPFAAFCSDPCDGRTQGTVGMMDSLAYRNDAALVFRRLIRSLPTRQGVLGVATCDKGLPAMMLALAAMRARRDHARAGRGPRLPRVRLSGWRLSVPRYRGDVAGDRGGPRPDAAARRARAVGPAGVARHGAALGAGAGGAA